jgi:hypothetical protein
MICDVSLIPLHLMICKLYTCSICKEWMGGWVVRKTHLETAEKREHRTDMHMLGYLSIFCDTNCH